MRTEWTPEQVSASEPVRPREAEREDTGAELERTERRERDNERDRQRAKDESA